MIGHRTPWGRCPRGRSENLSGGWEDFRRWEVLGDVGEERKKVIMPYGAYRSAALKDRIDRIFCDGWTIIARI